MRRVELKEINGAEGFKAFIVKFFDSTNNIYDLKSFSTKRKALNYIHRQDESIKRT